MKSLFASCPSVKLSVKPVDDDHIEFQTFPGMKSADLDTRHEWIRILLQYQFHAEPIVFGFPFPSNFIPIPLED